MDGLMKKRRQFNSKRKHFISLSGELTLEGLRTCRDTDHLKQKVVGGRDSADCIALRYTLDGIGFGRRWLRNIPNHPDLFSSFILNNQKPVIYRQLLHKKHG
jgi:hypothetical protein